MRLTILCLKSLNIDLKKKKKFKLAKLVEKVWHKLVLDMAIIIIVFAHVNAEVAVNCNLSSKQRSFNAIKRACLVHVNNKK